MTRAADRGLRERKPGVWEVRVYVGRDEQGRPKQVSRTVHGGKRKAQDARTALQAEVRRDQHRTTRGTVAHLLNRYMTHLEDQGLSPTTLRSYRSCIRANIEPTLGDLDVGDVDPEMLDGFYGTLRAKGLKPSTVHQYHSVLSGAFKQAKRWRWVVSSPVELATPPRVPRTEVIVPTVEQIHRLIDEAERRNPTLAALLFTAATTGDRRGELCGLRWSHIDLDARTMLIAQSVVEVGPGEWRVKDTKTHKKGKIALDDATVMILRHHRARLETLAAAAGVQLVADGFVFPYSIDGSVCYRPGNVTNFMATIRKKADCPGVVLHHFRHFMITQALAAGIDMWTVAGRARHDVAMTTRVYGHFLEEQDRRVADHMGELMPKTGRLGGDRSQLLAPVDGHAQCLLD